MPSVRNSPATVVAVLLSVLSVGYAILTPTNVLLSLVPVLLFLGLGVLVDNVSISPGSPREYPATLAVLPVAIGVVFLTILTSTIALLGLLFAAPLLAVAVLYDRAPISLRVPRQSRATLASLPIILLLGVYSVLTPTNVLLWVLLASVLFGTGVLLDWLLFDDAD